MLLAPPVRIPYNPRVLIHHSEVLSYDHNNQFADICLGGWKPMMRMKRSLIVIGAGLMFVAAGAGSSAGKLWAGEAAAQDAAAKPCYALPEYNTYKAASGEQNPQQKIKMLDDFVKAYPMSCMMIYVYRDYYLTDYALKNFAGTIDYADRMIGLGDKVDTQGKLEAYVARAQAYYVGAASDKSLQTPDAQTKARDASVQGLKTVDAWTKPETLAADQYEQQKKSFKSLLNNVAAMAATSLKDFPGAIGFYKAILMLDPNDAVSHFRLGVVYLQMMPPQPDDGFWELARSIGLKSPNGPNEAQVKTYLRGQIVRYQQPSCDKLADEELNSLITMAGSSADRPATFSIPSAADLDKARNDTANFIPALKAGGDAGKVMWLATCGLEYPDVFVRVMENPTMEGDAIVVKAFRPSAQDPKAAEDELNAATEPNMLIKVVGQPDAKRLDKDGQPVRFTGTLTGYTASPFLLTWEKAKINAEDIPEEKGATTKKPPVKRTPGAGATKPPVKKPAA
jgi:hypothetical protein